MPSYERHQSSERRRRESSRSTSQQKHRHNRSSSNNNRSSSRHRSSPNQRSRRRSVSHDHSSSYQSSSGKTRSLHSSSDRWVGGTDDRGSHRRLRRSSSNNSRYNNSSGGQQQRSRSSSSKRSNLSKSNSYKSTSSSSRNNTTKHSSNNNIKETTRKGFSLRLTRGLSPHNTKSATTNKGNNKGGRFHNIPNISSRRGRSITPKRHTARVADSSTNHNIDRDKSSGGITDKFKKYVKQSSKDRGNDNRRAPSLQPYQRMGSVAKTLRKRGKSMPSILRRSKSSKDDEDEDVHILEQTWLNDYEDYQDDKSMDLQMFKKRSSSKQSRRSSNSPSGKGSSKSSATSTVSEESEEEDGRNKLQIAQRQRALDSEPGKKSSVLLQSIHKSDQKKKVVPTREEKRQQLRRSRSANGRRKGTAMMGKGQALKKDPQSALNAHCRNHFKVPSSQQVQTPSPKMKKKQLEPESSFSPQPDMKKRSKSLPPRAKDLETSLLNSSNILTLNHSQMIQTPISPVASVDSSWRYKRLKQKVKRKERVEEERRKKNRRSKSCDLLQIVPFMPSLSEEVVGQQQEGYNNYNLREDMVSRLGGSAEYNNFSYNNNNSSYNNNSSNNFNNSIDMSVEKKKVQAIKKKVETLRKKQAEQRRRQSISASTTKDDSTFGSGTWGMAYGSKMPEPVSSLNGSYRRGSGSLTDSPAAAPDPPVSNESPQTIKMKRASNDPPLVEDDEFDDVAKAAIATLLSGSEDLNDINNIVIDDEDEEEDSQPSTLEPSTLGEEVKETMVSPPLHSSIRLKKPSAQPESTSISSNKSSNSTSSSKKKGVKAHIREIKVKRMDSFHSNNSESSPASKKSDFISELTIPRAIRRAPPLHSKVRSYRPQHKSKDHLSVYRESKLLEDQVNTDSDVATINRGPLTGNEIDVHSDSSTSKDQVSELTMPVALSPPFAQALKSYSKQKQQSEQKLQAKMLQKAKHQLEKAQAQVAALEQSQQSLSSNNDRSAEYPVPPRKSAPGPPPRSTSSSSSSNNMLGNMTAEDGSNSSLRDKNNIRQNRTHQVENMPFMDASTQEMGIYSGETNDYGQPNGRGIMSYDNGDFYDGIWSNGVQVRSR